MRNLYKMILLGLALLGSALYIPTTANAAATVITGPGRSYPPNLFLYGIVVGDLSTPYTNATTTSTAITGMSVAIPATKGDISKQSFRVCYSVDGTKATSTTGAVQINVNGAIDANATRYTSSTAGRNTISGCYTVARASKNASTVTLQAVSGDTATFTINAAYMEVWDITLN